MMKHGELGSQNLEVVKGSRFTLYVSRLSRLLSECTGQGYGPVLLSLFLVLELFGLVYV
jgi:hypothetical protein